MEAVNFLPDLDFSEMNQIALEAPLVINLRSGTKIQTESGEMA